MNEEIKIIELKASILEDNDEDANRLREELKNKKTCLINLMSSPGSGKTSTLLALNEYFKDELKWAVMEADIDSDTDAKTMIDNGIESIQLHTGGMCHLDADMTRQGLKELKGVYDLVVLENIGNLVCPAEYDTGANINMTILSVPEGDDKPAKYPLMYEVSDILVINKIDVMKVFGFDMDKVEKDVKSLNKDIKIFYVSAKTGEDIKELAEYLIDRIKGKQWLNLKR
ncbi:MAG: hydrogenase nickel incorporation protein HypB [Erysipelotrichaceae bacterium]|nr:hydrogenase nickel incorporation protein HypB [Erysipelotrichaceae bacterium]